MNVCLSVDITFVHGFSESTVVLILNECGPRGKYPRKSLLFECLMVLNFLPFFTNKNLFTVVANLCNFRRFFKSNVQFINEKMNSIKLAKYLGTTNSEKLDLLTVVYLEFNFVGI